MSGMIGPRGLHHWGGPSYHNFEQVVQLETSGVTLATANKYKFKVESAHLKETKPVPSDSEREADMSADVEEHVLKNYDIRRRIGKGVSPGSGMDTP